MPDDRELVKRCLTGDGWAWEALLKLYTGKVYSLCYRFTGQATDSEDLTQEIFIKVFRTLQTYDASQSGFSTWLNRIAHNHLVDHYRRARRDRTTASLDNEETRIDVAAGPQFSPQATLETRERRELLQAGLLQLSPEMREAVILRDLMGLDYTEMASVVNVPVGTVKSRINRGRKELGRVLKRMVQTEGAE